MGASALSVTAVASTLDPDGGAASVCRTNARESKAATKTGRSTFLMDAMEAERAVSQDGCAASSVGSAARMVRAWVAACVVAPTFTAAAAWSASIIRWRVSAPQLTPPLPRSPPPPPSLASTRGRTVDHDGRRRDPVADRPVCRCSRSRCRRRHRCCHRCGRAVIVAVTASYNTQRCGRRAGAERPHHHNHACDTGRRTLPRSGSGR